MYIVVSEQNGNVLFCWDGVLMLPRKGIVIIVIVINFMSVGVSRKDIEGI